MTRIAINGFGRIGRNICRALLSSSQYDTIELVAINDLGEPEVNAHLLQFDTTHGKFELDVSVEDDFIVVGNKKIQVTKERNPALLPWKKLNIDIVLECTGLFTDKLSASAHLDAGAKKVLVSAPTKDADATIVFGVNNHFLKPEYTVVSNASCTTNCLAPIVKALHDTVGIEKGMANTVHAYTNDQRLIDVYHTDLLRARAAAQSIIPSKTGAAAAIGLVIPELAGKLDGLSVRVPVINVSLLDFTFNAKRETSVDEINTILKSASEGMNGVLKINSLPLVSSDFNHNPASSIVDISHTKVEGDLVKVLAWYDNEWGFSNRMLDNTLLLAAFESDQ